MATIEVLRGRIFRTELRASIRTFGSDRDKTHWRTCNAAVRLSAERNPQWSAREVATHVLCNQPSTVELATRIAKPYGSAKDVILEQAQFWRERELPDDPWLAFAWSYFGRDQSAIDAADSSGLEQDSSAVVAYRICCRLTFNQLGKHAGFSKSTARRRWLAFLNAIETGQCVCASPHCSLNKQERRAEIARLIDELGRNRNFGKNRQHDRADSKVHSPSGNHLEDRARDEGVVPMGCYATAQVNGGMKVREHRLVWSQRRGRIPREGLI